MLVSKRFVFLLLGVCVLAAAGRAGAQPGPRAAGLVAEGDSLRAADQLEAARKAYEAARKADATYLEAYLRLGDLDLEQGAWGDAADHFDEVLERDPGNLAGRYYRAIAHRELGRFRPPMMKELLEWGKAEAHFEAVIARDSAFRDVLYQYALLEQYRGHHREAVALGKAQRRLRPDLAEARVGLFRLYRVFIGQDAGGARRWLQEQGDDYAAFFTAELARREEHYQAAEAQLTDLLARPSGIPDVAVHLALARLYSAQDRPADAEAQYWEAVEAITAPADAALVFEDVKYVLMPEELHAYRQIERPEAFQEFFWTMWARRDPLPAALENVRLAEHYRRLVHAEKHYEYYGFRTWHNNPDVYNRLDFRAVYRLNREFNDKGLIYLRHGPPHDRVATLGAAVPPNESWHYYEQDDLPEMTFHFSTKAGAAWQLVPVLMGPALVQDRLNWGHLYVEAYQAYQQGSELELSTVSMRMLEASQQTVDVALASDRHTWPRELEALEMPTVVAAFRDTTGQTRLEVFYSVPMADVVEQLPGQATQAILDVGLAVHDTTWQLRDRQHDTKRVALSQDVTDGILGSFVFTVPPDSYHVALHVRPEETNLLGLWHFDRHVPDFSREALAMSDVLLAANVGPARAGSDFMHGDQQLFPTPTGRFTRVRPVHTYFEIYHLTPGVDAQARYTVEYTLTPEKGKGGNLFNLFGLLGGDKGPALSLRSEHRSADASPAEYAQIDLSRVDPGEYTLDVRVVDLETGSTVVRSLPLVLN